MDRKPSRKKIIKFLLENDFSQIERDENHPLMRFIEDNVTLDELNDKPGQTLWKRLEKEGRIYNYVLALNCLNFVKELTSHNQSEIKAIRRKIIKCKEDHREFYSTVEEFRIAAAFKSKSWSYEFEPEVGDGDFDLVVFSDGKRVYIEVYVPDVDTSDVSNLRDKINKKLSDFDETDGDAVFLVDVGALPSREEYIENATEFAGKNSKLSEIIFYSYNLATMIRHQTNKTIIHNHWFKSPTNFIFKKMLDTVGGFEYKFYDYRKYDFQHEL
ncbi:MAG: hypothetical protein C4B59_15360 [Candidatus Methanogaster sp.]|uniref:Uncharacterized protein n=1 Tax=Candidatus Methanogaster sp. TaxID=3386292 RepID=A0AC61KYM0_9EURY|nr:MAG: hypothetical protein C4B59_15360 [ANME-2 cluster archaeon]